MLQQTLPRKTLETRLQAKREGKAREERRRNALAKCLMTDRDSHARFTVSFSVADRSQRLLQHLSPEPIHRRPRHRLSLSACLPPMPSLRSAPIMRQTMNHAISAAIFSRTQLKLKHDMTKDGYERQRQNA